MAKINITSLPDPTDDPIELLKIIINNFKTQKPNELIVLNFATVNEAEGVVARTMVFAGFNERGNILVGTDRNSRKYRDVLNNRNVAVTFLFVADVAGICVHQQIRVNGIAEECTKSEIETLWDAQPAFSKVRSLIHANKPKTLEEIKDKYQDLVDEYEEGKLRIPVPEKTTYLEIIPRNFQFYQSGHNCVADQIIYAKKENGWSMHRSFG